MPNEVHQVDSPQGFPLICAGDPNGAIRAPQGTLAIDNITPAVWQNANGVTTWTNISAGGTGITSWGLESTSHFTHAGDPNGAVTALAEGDLCLDTSTPALYIATGAGTVWTLVGPGGGAGITSWGLETTSHFTNNGDPNGIVTALSKGDLCLDITTPALYVADGAGTVWTLVGPGGTVATFPVTFDDGTHTYEITAGAGTMHLAVILDSGAIPQAFIDLDGTGSDFTSLGDLQLAASADGSNVIIEAAAVGGATVFTGATPLNINMTGLPTSDPGNSGQLWNNAGALHISP